MATGDPTGFQAFELRLTMADELSKTMEKLASTLDSTRVSLVDIAKQALSTGSALDKTAAVSEKAAKASSGIFGGPAAQKSPFQLAVGGLAAREAYRAGSGLLDQMAKVLEFQLEITRNYTPEIYKKVKDDIQSANVPIGDFVLSTQSIKENLVALIHAGNPLTDATSGTLVMLARGIEAVHMALGGTNEVLLETIKTMRTFLELSESDSLELLARVGLTARDMGVDRNATYGLVQTFAPAVSRMDKSLRADVMRDLVATGTVFLAQGIDPAIIKRLAEESRDITNPDNVKNIANLLGQGGSSFDEASKAMFEKGGYLNIMQVVTEGLAGKYTPDVQAKLKTLMENMLGLDADSISLMTKIPKEVWDKARESFNKTDNLAKISLDSLGRAGGTPAGMMVVIENAFNNLLEELVTSKLVTSLLDLATKIMKGIVYLFTGPKDVLVKIGEAIAEAIKRIIYGGHDAAYMTEHAWEIRERDAELAYQKRVRAIGVANRPDAERISNFYRMMNIGEAGRRHLSGRFGGNPDEIEARLKAEHDELIKMFPGLGAMETYGPSIITALTNAVKYLKTIDFRMAKIGSGG